MGLPQGIMLGLMMGSLLHNANKHGQTQKVNFWIVLCVAGMQIALLIWGGFFN